MIVQTASEGQPHRIIFQTDHARMSGQIAAVFGNDDFASPTPQEPLIFVAAHHDEGWQPVDERVEMDPETGLPYHLTRTPLPYLVQTSAGSPAFNEAHHPYSGILSSMHTVGLFNGRYGLSDKIFIDLVPAEHKPAMQGMLDEELARQARLELQLANQPETMRFVTTEALFRNYKLLQFFDTLALYFHMSHEQARGEAQFLNVPRSLADDVTMTIAPVEAGTYRCTPYPFREDTVTLNYTARRMHPQPLGTDLRPLLATISPETERVTLIR